MKRWITCLMVMAGTPAAGLAQDAVPAINSAHSALSHQNNASAGLVFQNEQSRFNQRPGLTPYVSLPPESLQPKTLIVPLPSEGGPAVITKPGTVEAVPNVQPSIPKANGKKMLQPIVD